MRQNPDYHLFREAEFNPFVIWMDTTLSQVDHFVEVLSGSFPEEADEQVSHLEAFRRCFDPLVDLGDASELHCPVGTRGHFLRVRGTSIESGSTYCYLRGAFGESMVRTALVTG